MSRRPLSELSKHLEDSRPSIGSTDRVARIFVPPAPSHNQIRLPVQSPQRALARRRLARLIESRRVVS